MRIVHGLFIAAALGLACTPDKGDDTDANTQTTDVPGTSADTDDTTTDDTTTDDASTVAPTTSPEETTVAEGTTVGDPTEGETTEGGNDAFLDELAGGCGFESPCGDVVLGCDTDMWLEECTAPFDTATQCVLERLAAGEGFALRFDLNGYGGAVAEIKWYDVVFDGQGGALRQAWVEDVGTLENVTDGPTQQCNVKPADYFTTCLSTPPEDPAHNECRVLMNWFSGCGTEVDPVCPAP